APLVVVMGVSGCGKTTLGRLLAQRLNAEFLEGDDLHPPRNVERMAAGIALTDADRRDWLLQIAQQLADAHASNHGLVVSCSALKRRYRDVLRAASAGLAFVHLNADRALLEARMDARSDHFMPASLLDSQLQTLEPPTPAERAASFDAALPAAQIAEQAAAWLAKLPPAPKARR
ncbi:MAG TPA: gluconokinase, partial [Burkholderiaceae bacterium]|nr:gluconokinase [Burkholderiaceae bacterium]